VLKSSIERTSLPSSNTPNHPPSKNVHNNGCSSSLQHSGTAAAPGQHLGGAGPHFRHKASHHRPCEAAASASASSAAAAPGQHLGGAGPHFRHQASHYRPREAAAAAAAAAAARGQQVGATPAAGMLATGAAEEDVHMYSQVHIRRVGHVRVYTPYMTVYLVIFLPKLYTPYINCSGHQEAARSTTFGTPLSALLKTIYSESWD